MEPIKIAFAGAGGYADYCLGLLLDFIPQEEYQLVGIADPFAEQTPRIGFFREKQIPLYSSVEALLAAQRVDALYVASPITFHKQQCVAALSHGCAILCEKPLAATYKDVLDLRNRVSQSAKPFGVGFQWSFAPAILQAKQDILAGRYGKAISLKAYISWQRFDDYYRDSTWKGRLSDADGNRINDSVVTNATAHYLHNIFFMMGQRLNGSAMPVQVRGSLYRAKPIESFDSCFLKGTFANGTEFLFLSTHSGDSNTNPIVEYTFENGTICIDTNDAVPIVRGCLNNRELVYGSVSTTESDSSKVMALLSSARDGSPMVCPIEAILPHQAVCAALFDQMPVHTFPQSLVYRNEDPRGWLVKGLCDDLQSCFTSLKTPHEGGCSWASADTSLDLSAYKI